MSKKALDALGVAIANAGYEWTPEMRKAYEQGIRESEWVGYTNEDRERIVPVLVQSLLNHDEKTMAGLLKAILIDIEAQLKEKNT